jgi:putative hydrolase of the HAD superfamily
MRLAAEFEARANPAWPMPGLKETLRALRGRRLALGMIADAQFYTIELFPALLDHWAELWGFDPKLQFYSYLYGQRKPGLKLYQMAIEALAHRGIAPSEALYVGSDMLEDIWPAWQLGLRTALFAGDARSFNPRTGDPRIQGIHPDLVLTELWDINLCIRR